MTEPWSDAHVRPLWTIAQAHSTARTEPRSTIWPWRTMKPLVYRAAELTDPAISERRVLSLIDPAARDGEFQTITNLNAGLQILLPGEAARPHRHSMDALRFVLSGEGAVTRVDGVTAEMAYGDLVLTPGWCWHEHWHEGDAPIVWLDVLNVHAHLNLGTFAFEPGPVHDVPDVPPGTVFRYPLSEAKSAADSVAPSSDRARHARYVNPLTGGPVMPLLDCELIRLDPNVETLPVRTSAHAVCAVVGGHGETFCGEQRIAWEPRDVFTLPAHVPLRHRATETAYLFVCSDREIYRRLELLTDETG
jgi:gentisate 1,2-dioxygenase